MPDTPPEIPPGHKLVVMDDVDSTNAEAMRRAVSGERGPLWIMARRQTSGRGRSGREWVSKPGNLYASLLLDLTCPPAAAHQIALLAGIAVFDAVARLAGGGNEDRLDGLRLKWPNDLLIGSAKCAGILAETISAASLGRPGDLQSVVGIGINLVSAPENIGRPVTYLGAHGMNADPGSMLSGLAFAFHGWLGRWQQGRNFAALREAWLDRAGALGEPMNVNCGGGVISGSFAGIDDAGALLMLDQNGATQRFTFGDISLPRAGCDD